MEKTKYKVRLNSIEKIEEILQEIYDQACRHLTEINNEINKLVNSTNLGAEEVSMDDKAKYSKSIHDFMGDKNKAISTKLEVAKFMIEVLKHNGDVDATMNDKNVVKRSSLSIKDIKATINGTSTDSDNYNLKKN